MGAASERDWVEHVNTVAGGTLYPLANSRPYLQAHMRGGAADDYEGFTRMR
jgi:hypothetical protein